MYIGDVHILTYIIFLGFGTIIGQFIDWMNRRILENKPIFSKDILKDRIRINKFTVILTILLYLIILYRFGIKEKFLENLDLTKYMILIPILISIMVIDYRERIIPNRLTFTLFEIGIIFVFLYGINNLFIVRDYLLGAIVAILIFGIIAILGRIIAGKEAMGFGDVKLLAVLGLYFGVALTISIAVLSFLVAGIIYGVIIAYRKKKKIKKEEYISFGPCIVISTILCIIIPEKTILSILLTVFTLGRYKRM